MHNKLLNITVQELSGRLRRFQVKVELACLEKVFTEPTLV